MGDTWITDMSHFLEVGSIPVDIPLQAFRLAEYLGGLVMVATGWVAGETLFAAQPCRRRPGRRPCPGPIAVSRSQVPPQIDWRCSTCGDCGVISGWRGTPWDLTNVWKGQQMVEVGITTADYDEVRRVTIPLLREAEWVVRSARLGRGVVVLRGSEEALIELRDGLAFAANHSVDRHRGARLDEAFEKIDAAIL
ncbi:MAG: hypothetical protein ACYDGR_14200 [Candidatus Dormibacteria bacterium]